MTRFEVRNFGIGSATLIKTGSPNVWQQLDAIEQLAPDVALIALGTNNTVGGDRRNSRASCWEQNEGDKSGDTPQKLRFCLLRLPA